MCAIMPSDIGTRRERSRNCHGSSYYYCYYMGFAEGKGGGNGTEADRAGQERRCWAWRALCPQDGIPAVRWERVDLDWGRDEGGLGRGDCARGT